MPVTHFSHTPRKRSKKAKSSAHIALFDKLVVAMGILNLFATLPQVITIWMGQDASGVSTLSWGYYSLFSLVFLLYGVLHREKPIIASYIGSTALFSSIFIGSIVY